MFFLFHILVNVFVIIDEPDSDDDILAETTNSGDMLDGPTAHDNAINEPDTNSDHSELSALVDAEDDNSQSLN